MAINLPRKIVEEASKRGVSVEEVLIQALAKAAGLDPKTVAEARLELAEKYVEEGRGLLDTDPVQASEKLYKAAEEAVKALATYFNVSSVLRRVEERGGWSVADLVEAVEAISDKLGAWFIEAWDSAWVLHVWGFHEAKLTSESIKRRLPQVEKIVKEAGRLIRSR
ncbi:MAG: PaREP1 family protein [Desulfurococcaceae archaeon]